MLTDIYNGLYYFPNLPPNLIRRFWFDPNGNKLVFTGQFVADPVNGNYVMLNVLRGDDLAAVNGLCPASDTTDYPIWTNAVAHLSTPEYTFYENPAQPGSYVINPNDTVTRYAGDLVEVTNSDTAVDSYAMSAAGPGQGYVTYVVANGLNPAYAGDPIQVYIARTAPPLVSRRAGGGQQRQRQPVQPVDHLRAHGRSGRAHQQLYVRLADRAAGEWPAAAAGNGEQLDPVSPANPGVPGTGLYAGGHRGAGPLRQLYFHALRLPGPPMPMAPVVTTNWSALGQPHFGARAGSRA